MLNADTADISFPTESTDNTSRLQFVPSKCANGQTFCEEVDNYPLAMIEDVVEREGHRYSELFGHDILTQGDDGSSITNRFGGFNETTMCDIQREVIYPKTGQTKDHDWLFIVNSDKFQQGVVVEKCTYVVWILYRGSILDNTCLCFYKLQEPGLFVPLHQELPERRADALQTDVHLPTIAVRQPGRCDRKEHVPDTVVLSVRCDRVNKGSDAQMAATIAYIVQHDPPPPPNPISWCIVLPKTNTHTHIYLLINCNNLCD